MACLDNRWLSQKPGSARKATSLISSLSDRAEGPLKIKAFELIFESLVQESQAGGTEREKTAPKSQKKSIASKDDKSANARILRLRDDGFLKELRSISEIRKELAANGWHYPVTSLSGPLQALVQRRELRRLKVKEGNKFGWKYSEI